MSITNLMIDENMSIRDALKKLDSTAKKILLVVEQEKLKAVVTDGDIRRWILRNGELTAPVKAVMNCDPIYLTEDTKSEAKALMKKHLIEAVPIVDNQGVLKSLVFWNDETDEILVERPKINCPVVIMAGGLGTRLYPYTKILPKPLIPIGDTPIIERIIHKFREFNCEDFFLTVNYKKNFIKSYFNDLEKEYNVYYVEEDKPLGTGGSLYLLKDTLKETFFVSNCDVLIDADYASILEYHKESGNKVTVVTSVKNYVIPYGVISLNEDGSISSVHEKPEYSFLTNTGMYVIEPEVLDDIPSDTFYNLPDIISKYLEEGVKVGVYPISEKSWMDMGQLDEMQEMMERLGVK